MAAFLPNYMYRKFQLPTFGNHPNENFDIFIKNFLKIGKGLGLNETRLLDLLPLHLKAKAARDFEDLQRSNTLMGKNLNEVFEILRERYSCLDRYKFSLTMETIKMLPNESISSYYDKIRESAEKVGLVDIEDTTTQTMIRCKFWEGLTNQSLKKYLLENYSQDIIVIVKNALEWEFQNHHVLSKCEAITRVNHIVSDNSEQVSDVNFTRRLRRRRCATCHNRGHLASKCPMKAKKQVVD